MDKNVKKAKSHFALGFTLAGIAIGAGAALAALYRQKQREKVYHEAEIKAMNELDDLMAENESACAACDCMEDCAAHGGTCADEEQLDIFEENDRPAPAEEAPEEPAQAAAKPEEEQPS